MSSDRKIVMLKEEKGERQLPIWIGYCETQMLLSRLENEKLEFPRTYDFFWGFLRQSNLKVENAYIYALINNIYQAQVHAARHKLFLKQEIKIACRPTDALLTALYFGKPIFVSADLMDNYSVTSASDEVSSPAYDSPAITLQPMENISDPYQDFWENFVVME
jgi:uncharacterized protein